MRFASSFSSVLYFLAILYFSLCIQTLRCMLVIWSAEVYSEGLFPTQRGELSLVCSWRQQLAGSLSFHSPAALPFPGLFSFSRSSSSPKPVNVLLPLLAHATRRTRPETAHAHPSQMQPTTSSGRNRQQALSTASGTGKISNCDYHCLPQAGAPPAAAAPADTAPSPHWRRQHRR